MDWSRHWYNNKSLDLKVSSNMDRWLGLKPITFKPEQGCKCLISKDGEINIQESQQRTPGLYCVSLELDWLKWFFGLFILVSEAINLKKAKARVKFTNQYLNRTEQNRIEYRGSVWGDVTLCATTVAFLMWFVETRLEFRHLLSMLVLF